MTLRTLTCFLFYGIQILLLGSCCRLYKMITNLSVLLSVIIFLYVPLVSYYFALYIISMVMHDGKRRKQQHLSSVCVVCLQYFFCVYKSLFGGLVILRKLYSTFLYLYYNNRKFLILA